MGKLTPIIAFLIISAITTAAEDPLIVDGDGLELVREYEIVGETFELVYENEELTAEIEDVPGRLIPLVLYNFIGTLKSELVYLDGDLQIEKILSAPDSYGLRWNYVHPIADTGYYVKTYDPSSHENFYPDYKYDIFDLDDTYIGSVEGFGVVFLIEENGNYLISNPGGKTLYKELNIYDLDGNLKGKIERENDGFILLYRKDKPWVIISGTRRGYGGIEVYDMSDNLQYAFENITRGWPLYGSASYTVIKSIRESPRSEPGYSRETIRVYNGTGELIWDYELPEEETRPPNLSVKVSENEKYICIVTESKLEDLSSWKLGFKILDIATGKKIYGVENTGINKGYVKSVSDDGSTLLVYQRDYPLDGYSKLLIINNEKTIGEVSTHPDNGKIEGHMTPDGKYLIAGIPARIKVFKISHN